MRFSPSTMGWYPEFLEYPNPPADLVEVSDELYEALRGKPIELGSDGLPREYVPPATPEAPRSVTMRQARLALLEAGKLAGVDAAIAAMPSPQKEAAQIEWEFAATVNRDSPFLQDLAGAIGLDDAHLDQLFALAASK